MAKRNSNTNATEHATTAPLSDIKLSLLEERYEQFSPELIANSYAVRASPVPYMRKLNQIFTICAGMGVVMRIVAGNPVVADSHDPNDPDSAAPLSKSAIGFLVMMTAELCEKISDDISILAGEANNAEVQS